MAKMTKEGVLKAVKDNNVKFIRLWFTDILGVMKSFAITPNELETSAFRRVWALTALPSKASRASTSRT